MPTLQCHVDGETYRILKEVAMRLEKSPEELAENAISEAALEAKKQDRSLAIE